MSDDAMHRWQSITALLIECLLSDRLSVNSEDKVITPQGLMAGEWALRGSLHCTALAVFH